MNKCITCGVKGWFQGHCQKCRSQVICVCANFKNCKHSKPTDQKPIWEKEFNKTFKVGSISFDEVGNEINRTPATLFITASREKELKSFIKEVETAAYERGKADGHRKGFNDAVKEYKL